FMIGSRKLASSSYGSSVGPDIFPFVLGLVLSLLSIRLFYEAFRGRDQESRKEKLQYKPFIIILLSTLIYILTLETIGYV
ncbi:tripartite tricarboxylate transporter TctB family protein, partial [Bacillus subtilis]